MELEEKPFKRRKIFSGRAVGFFVDTVILPDGKKATREYLDHPGAVAVLPFMDAQRIVLVKQFRYPIGEVTYEIPAGKLDPGEGPLSCVRRELREETGFTARSIRKILSYWPTPAFANEVLHVYIARGLTRTAASPDEDEFIEQAIVPFARALEWVKRGRIRDSKTVIALLYWAARKSL